MNKIAVSLGALLLLGATVSPTRAERTSTSEVSQAWQASYTAEAAGNYDAAIDALDQLPASHRQGYLASFRRGWLNYCLARHAESAAAYGKAIALEPDSVEARVAQLLPLMASGRWPDLIKAAEQALKHDPQNYLALQRMGYAQYSSQHFPNAEQTYRRIVKLYPSDIEMRVALGWAVLRMGKQAEASELFRGVLELAPKHISAMTGLQAASAGHNGRAH